MGIKVKVFYGGKIEQITKKNFEEVWISEGLNFARIVDFIFSSYLNIQKIFIPGTVSFLLNNKVPKIDDILKEGDIIKISAIELKDIRKIIEKRVLEEINRYCVGINFNEIKDIIFNEESGEDFNQLTNLFAVKISDINELNRALQIVNNVWNYFPHKCLGGFCPMEKILEGGAPMSKYNKK